jgi:hypothetical protein
MTCAVPGNSVVPGITVVHRLQTVLYPVHLPPTLSADVSNVTLSRQKGGKAAIAESAVLVSHTVQDEKKRPSLTSFLTFSEVLYDM